MTRNLLVSLGTAGAIFPGILLWGPLLVAIGRCYPECLIPFAQAALAYVGGTTWLVWPELYERLARWLEVAILVVGGT